MLVKGFKDEKGRFRPTGNKKVRDISDNGDDVEVNISINDAEELEEFAREKAKMEFTHGTYLTQPIFKFENAPEDVKDKILEKNRDINIVDEWWSDYDGLIYDKKSGISDYEALSNYNKKYYDLDRGQYIQFPDLKVKDDKKFAEMLGLPESLINKIDFHFESVRENNTELEIKDLGTYEDINKHTKYSDYIKYTNEEDERLSEKEFNQVKKAIEKWSDLMDDAWSNLRDSYEHQQSDEAIIDTINANEYDFDEDGNIV